MSRVIIIGGGPVGLGLAIDLAGFGIPSTVLEQSTELHQIPKGQNLTQRVGEMFRKWGLTEAVQSASPIPQEFGNAGVVTYGTLLGDYHYDWFQRSKVGAFYHARNERLPQYQLERVLRDRALSTDQIALITGAKVTELTPDAHSVQVTYERAGRVETITGAYCVGCDGARSPTRNVLGIASDADHEGPRMALLVFRSTELHDLLERYPEKSIYNVMNSEMNGYWQFLGRVDLEGGWFFHSPVPEGTTRDNFDFERLLFDMAGAEFSLEFEHIGFWDLRITQAKTYRKGNAFIAGDACHSHPPYGGYGINTGLEDAANLSWKLAAELKGWAGAKLLNSYTEERHPVFRSVNADFISRMITDFREFTNAFSPSKDKDAFEAAWQARAIGGDGDVTEFLPNYAGSPIVVGGEGQSGAKGKHQTSARPGHHLAPHGIKGISEIWEDFGPWFTLFDFSNGASIAAGFTEAAAELGAPLSAVHNANAKLRSVYGCDAILVRPDLFVAWVAGTGSDNPETILRQAIGVNS